MKVLTLSAIYPNEQNDPIGRSVAFLDRALAKQGVRGVTLFLRPWAPGFLARRSDRWKHLALRNRVEKENGLTVVFDQYFHFPRRTRLDLSARFMAARAHRLIVANGWNFDLIHGQSIYPSALAACELAKEYGVPFIITLRDDLGHLEDMVSGKPKLRQRFQNMFHRVDGVSAHGPAILRELPHYLPEDGMVPVLMAPNGVDVEGIERILSSLPPPQLHPWSILSVGHLYRLKGIHENLQALEKLDKQGYRDWQYTIVGDGPYREELRSLSMKLGLKERVRFVGKVSFEKAIGYMREAEIFSLPSFAESFGNVYAEAAVCGKPVIGCRGNGAEVTVLDGKTGILVPPRDVQALANALAYLLQNPEKARMMGEKGRERIRDFTWERTAGIYKKVMEKIVSPGKG